MTVRRLQIEYNSLIEALDAAPGDRPFVTFWADIDEQETVSFAAFRKLARQHAGRLRLQGVRKGDRVVIIMPQGIAAMAAFVAAMLLGAVPAFLAYPNFKIEAAKYRSGLAGVTKNLGARVVVIDEMFPEDLLGHVSLGAGADLLRISAAAGDEVPLEIPHPDPTAVAFIQHSAGTTGLQKGVALTHAAVLRQLAHLAKALQLADSDRIYSWLPLYHDMGLIACFMLPMVFHLPVVMQSPIDWVMQPGSMLEAITEHRSTLAWTPNFALQFLPRRVPQSRWAEYDLSSMRALINCSEPVRASSIDELRAAFSAIGLRKDALHSSYAMAENVFAVTQSRIESPDVRVHADPYLFRSEHKIVEIASSTPGALVFVSSGRLLEANEVRVVSETGTTLGDAVVGEILIRSDSLFTGYFNRSDLTAEAFCNGWYKTGDLGFLLRGELFVVGRKKDILIVGGENLYPQDIEEIVFRHPAIHDGRAIALGVLDRDLGTQEIVVVAEVETEELLADREKIETEIRNSIVGGLGLAIRTVLLKPPKWIVKSTAGKPSRSATREKLLAEHPEFAYE